MKWLALITLVMLGWILLLPSRVFAYTGNVRLKITTVIDNAGVVPAAGGNFSYKVNRITRMSGGSNCSLPENPDSAQLTWRHGESYTLDFGASSNGKVNLVSFEPAGGTDSHISLSSIEFISNIQPYTYTDNGKANPAVNAFNWGQIVGNSSTAEVKLHFRYNPDIGELAPEPDPDPAVSKQIDYLGDGAGNPDTAAAGKNDYRLYLGMTTEAAPEADPDKDIIFLLDISNSMLDSFGSGTRLENMKRTVNSAVDILTQNPQNRISVISFETNVKSRITNSSDAAQIKSVVNSLKTPKEENKSGGGTNYYEGLNQAGKMVRALTAGSGRETVVFFLTDGQPTAATPAVNAIGYTTQGPVGLIYAAEAARNFPQVDRFYSVFIGGSSGHASTLQTITQYVPVGVEKFMLHANDQTQLQNAFARFLSKVGGSLYEVKIEDGLSEYVDYAYEPKAVKVTGGTVSPLAVGSDYEFSFEPSSKKVIFRLLKNTSAASQYLFSFNVKTSDKAFDYYGANESYPDTGDPGTDFSGNATSSGKPGFFSNTSATLSYSFAGGKTGSKTYPRPVVQVVMPEITPLPVTLEAQKELTGKALEAGQFTFEIATQQEGGSVLAAAVNDETGKIVFDAVRIAKAGQTVCYMREKKPDVPEPGMTYDDTVYKLTITAQWVDGVLTITDVASDSAFVFKNKYEPAPVTVALTAHKDYSGEGRTLSAGQFRFTLRDESAGVVETVTNEANGDIHFTPLVFTREGEYKYEVREVIPSPADEHIVYDYVPRHITIQVADVNAALTATVSFSPDDTFKNLFVFKPAEPQIQVKTILKGMRLGAGQFSFELKDLQNSETVVEQNDVNGDVCFTGLHFDQPGEYHYEVRELIPGSPDRYMVYADDVVHVTIQVTDAGSGDLAADVNYSKDPPVFYNTYQIRGGIW